MSRLLLILAFAMFLGQATGVSTLLADEPDCEQECAGDDADGDCPPGCQMCNCCSASRVLAPEVSGVTLLATLEEPAQSSSDEAPASPEPREILHVPKPALA